MLNTYSLSLLRYVSGSNLITTSNYCRTERGWLANHTCLFSSPRKAYEAAIRLQKPSSGVSRFDAEKKKRQSIQTSVYKYNFRNTQPDFKLSPAPSKYRDYASCLTDLLRQLSGVHSQLKVSKRSSAYVQIDFWDVPYNSDDANLQGRYDWYNQQQYPEGFTRIRTTEPNTDAQRFLELHWHDWKMVVYEKNIDAHPDDANIDVRDLTAEWMMQLKTVRWPQQFHPDWEVNRAKIEMLIDQKELAWQEWQNSMRDPEQYAAMETPIWIDPEPDHVTKNSDFIWPEAREYDEFTEAERAQVFQTESNFSEQALTETSESGGPLDE
mmetsp:Transcript_4027/g.6036  ORF Transcript_4027/g.6036 Transcript_4027/m.6036 type:complete len:324 (+) Transcript_4027:50-1021(+)